MVLLLVGLWVGQGDLRRSLAERDLVGRGKQVPNARVVEVNGIARPEQGALASLRPHVKLEWIEAGRTRSVEGRLPNTDGFIRVGDKVAISIDPDDPTRWVDRIDKPDIWRECLLSLVVMVLALGVAGVALVQRSRLLGLWKNGEAAEATVLEVRPSAFAPLSRAVRMAMRDGRDRRVISALVPSKAGVPEPGETLWLIVPEGRTSPAIVAKLYE